MPASPVRRSVGSPEDGGSHGHLLLPAPGTGSKRGKPHPMARPKKPGELHVRGLPTGVYSANPVKSLVKLLNCKFLQEPRLVAGHHSFLRQCSAPSLTPAVQLVASSRPWKRQST